MIGLGIANMMANFDADTKLWLAQCGTRPSNTVVSAVDTFIRQCKVDGNWSLLDRFWLFGQDLEANAKISIVNPTSTQITAVNTPTFTANQGYTGNGTAQYLRTGFVPSTDGVNYIQDSASLFLYSRTNNVEGKIDFGAENAASANITYLVPRYTGNLFYGRINNTSAGVISVSNSNSQGLFCVRRTASNAIALYKNGASVATDTDVSQGVPTIEFYSLGYNLNGSASLFATKQQSVLAIGGGGIDQLKFYAAIQSLATSIGFQV